MLQFPAFMTQYPWSTKMIPSSSLLPSQWPHPQRDELLLAMEESHLEDKTGKQIHQPLRRYGCSNDLYVNAALVDMYAKCGEIEAARLVFNKMADRDLVSWTSMISGYAHNGYNSETLEFFDLMRGLEVKPNRVSLLSVLLACDVKPNQVTFTCILSACSHSGLLEEEQRYFGMMSKEFGIAPMLNHYACMVDLLGRAGQLSKAENLIENIPVELDSSIWGSLLGACRIYGDLDLGERIADRIFQLNPTHAGYHVMLANIYAYCC
ncbi:hypothetical protein HHK36_015649 [Tetracentron sinense]|uniref:Pentatricopeptide repeat-containing protein n=1 Tax=Tetracentron sinense TaxID=13715 RepID=A0A834Z2L1_TETSI|nr:hypothetical protein HHK36_015649 [Tetracentron sinense]